MRITRLAGAMLLLVARAASAQNHGAFPTPTPAVCTQCSGTSAGLKLWPFGAPIQSFRGRFIDSTSTQDITGPVRTIRAGGVFPAPEQNRLYMILGSTVAGYTLPSFFDSKLTGGLSYVPVARYSPPSEQWLSPEFQFYAESSSWTVSVIHSQTAIGDNIDYDDRGFVYVPYKAFGWGIFDSNLKSVVQVLDGATVTPEKILAVRSGPRYYAIVSDARTGTAIYDVSTPASSSTNELRMIAPALTSLSKATSPDGNNIVGAVTAEGNVIIATPENLALGGGPSQTFSVTYPYQYSFIVSDGTNFYATKSSERGPMTVSVFSPNGSGSYTETAHEFPGAFRPGTFRYGASYLAAVGSDVEGVTDVRLFKLKNGVPRDVPLNGYFRNFYTAPQQGYVRTPGYLLARDAVVYRQGNRDYLFFSAHGLGDVYELVGGSGATPVPGEPVVNTFTANPTTIAAGGSATLSWTTTNATSLTINNGVGSVGATGSRSVSPATTTIYRLEATAVAGIATATATVTVTGLGPMRGDANGDNGLTSADVFYLINNLFAGGPGPAGNGDANSDGGVTSGDIFFLINHIFAGGPAPPSAISPLQPFGRRSIFGSISVGSHDGVAGSKVVIPVRVETNGNAPDALAFKVVYSPASAVKRATIRRAGITAPRSPLFEAAPSTADSASYVAAFSPGTLSGDQPGGEVVAEIEIELRAAARAETEVSLTIEPETAALGDLSGDSMATVASGSLLLSGGTVTVWPRSRPAAAPDTRPHAHEGPE